MQAAGRVYTNPVWGHDFPDPQMIFFKGLFYVYGTETAAVGPGFQVMSSPDMVHWTRPRIAFTPPWSTRHLWAPEVVHYRGKFYMTYSALNPETKRHDTGIAVSDTPLGPFEHRAILVHADETQGGAIDSTIFFERGGSPYLIYSQEHPRCLVMQPLARDLMSVRPERIVLLHPDRPREHDVTEAPTLIKRNGVYHLFFSTGWFQARKGECNYAVCHASSRQLYGPYVKDREPLITTVPGHVYGPGHQAVITTPAGEMWLVYHGWDPTGEPRYGGGNSGGRSLRIDRILWDGDTPRVVGPTTDPQTAPIVEKRAGMRANGRSNRAPAEAETAPSYR
jgi:beta-xylosidase